MKLKVVLLVGCVWLLASCGGSQRKIAKSDRRIPKNASHQTSGSEKGSISTDSGNVPKNIPNIEELPNPIHQKPSGNTSVERYVSLYKMVAMEEMVAFGIPASITLAQGILESGSGASELTRRSNNHFGIKCHDWTGERVYHDDDIRKECFRKYDNPNYSYRDHSLFLRNRSRYSPLFKLAIDDYKGWAYGLKSAGYATDPRYPVKLIDLIERHQLHRYDREVLARTNSGKSQAFAMEEEKPIEVYTVQRGDTLYSISRRFGVSVDTLKRKNNLGSDNLSVGQQLNVGN